MLKMRFMIFALLCFTATELIHSAAAVSVPNCGRVGNGTATYPWMALVKFENPNNEDYYCCGGTLISERYVLTAAHWIRLVLSRIVVVRLGEWNTKTDPNCDENDCAPPPQDIRVSEIIPHPDYKSLKTDNDIALLRLENAAVLNGYVMPICLPTQPNLRSDTFINVSMEVARWGIASANANGLVQEKATVIVASLEQCQAIYRTLQRSGTNLKSPQLCTAGSVGNASCRGDVSTMVQDKIDGQTAYVVTGVASYGPVTCALDGALAVYTRVGAFMDWIENTMLP